MPFWGTENTENKKAKSMKQNKATSSNDTILISTKIINKMYLESNENCKFLMKKSPKKWFYGWEAQHC